MEQRHIVVRSDPSICVERLAIASRQAAVANAQCAGPSPT